MTRATPSFIVTASGCAPPIPRQAGSQHDAAAQRPAELLARELRERLIRALQDSLRADVDPRAGRHLTVHRQALPLQLAERVPVGPLAHQVRIRD